MYLNPTACSNPESGVLSSKAGLLTRSPVQRPSRFFLFQQWQWMSNQLKNLQLRV